MEELAKPYFNGRPNSYILTKALAECYVKKHCLLFDDENNNEHLLSKESNDVIKNNIKNNLVSSGHHIIKTASKPFKTYVVRPSIVYNAKSEPTEGWIDSYNGIKNLTFNLLNF